MSDEGRSLPQSLESEQAVLGGLMLTPDKLDELDLQPDDFYRASHGRLFRLMVEMAKDGEPIEMVAIVERLVASGKAEEYGGLSYVSHLSDSVPSAENLDYYAGLVRSAAQRRRIIQAAQAIAESAYAQEQEIEDLIAFAESRFKTVIPDTRTDWVGQEQDVEEAFDWVMGDRDTSDMLTTGFPDLDGFLGGIQRGTFMLLAGRPATAKTACSDTLAVHWAEQGHTVGFLSLEMARRRLAVRRLSNMARVDGRRLLKGKSVLTSDELAALRHAKKRLKRLPLHIDDPSGLTFENAALRIRRLKRAHPSLRVVFVDFVGLLKTRGGERRHEAMAEVAKGLQQLAKELQITLVGLVQLGRQVEARADKRPTPSDLRDTGAFEEAADIIIGFYREEKYDKRTKVPGLVELIILKGRDGEEATAYGVFSGPFTRVDPLHRL